MSAIWSASSSTVTSTASSEQTPRLDQVAEPAGRRDEHVDAALERVDLRSYGTPPNAVFVNRPSAVASGVSASLTCMASSRVGTRTSALGRCGAARPLGRDPGQQRQAERERLAGAGLAAAEHVPAGERVRDGGGLDRERRGDALAVQRADERGRHTERVESRRGNGIRRARFDRGRGGDRLVALRPVAVGRGHGSGRLVEDGRERARSIKQRHVMGYLSTRSLSPFIALQMNAPGGALRGGENDLRRTCMRAANTNRLDHS